LIKKWDTKKRTMNFNNIESDLSSLYNKSRESFDECIRNNDNEFLKDELSMSLDDIVIAEKDIKIVFSKRAFEEYIIQVCLVLFEGSKEIGKYTYITNDKKEGVDDNLVFY